MACRFDGRHTHTTPGFTLQLKEARVTNFTVIAAHRAVSHSTQRCHVPAAVFAGCKTFLEVVNQGRVGKGVGLGVVGDPGLLGMGAVPESLLLMLQVLICSLRKDTHHLTMDLSSTSIMFQSD